MSDNDFDDEIAQNIFQTQLCSETLETSPCVRDTLKLFVNQINENRHEIKLLKERLERVESTSSSRTYNPSNSVHQYDLHDRSKVPLPGVKPKDTKLRLDQHWKHKESPNNKVDDENVHVRKKIANPRGIFCNFVFFIKT